MSRTKQCHAKKQNGVWADSTKLQTRKTAKIERASASLEPKARHE
jgi:hypothetical protein